MTKQSGGAAFPTFAFEYGQIMPMGGMTLRDYFAAHAPEVPDMQTFPIKQWTKEEIADLGNGWREPRKVLYQESWAERSARWAIEYADAMIAEREKP